MRRVWSYHLELSGAFVGKSKESLDAVDLSVPLDMAVQSFGCFCATMSIALEGHHPIPRCFQTDYISSVRGSKFVSFLGKKSLLETRKINFLTHSRRVVNLFDYVHAYTRGHHVTLETGEKSTCKRF